MFFTIQLCWYRPRFIAIWMAFLVSFVIAGCVGTSENTGDDRFRAELKTINRQLEDPAFTSTASATLTRVDNCKATFTNAWRSATAAQKGYSRTETVTVIDFARDVDWVAHEMPRDDVREHRIERWAEHIRIAFAQPMPTNFLTARVGESKLSSEKTNLDFMTVSVSTTATTSQVRNLTHDLNSMIEECQATLPNWRALNTPIDGSSEVSFSTSYSNLAQKLSPRQARRFALALFAVLLPENCLSSDDLVRLTFFPVSPDRKGELGSCRIQLSGMTYQNVMEAANKARIEQSRRSPSA